MQLISFALKAFAQVPHRLMKQLNPRGRSQCLVSGSLRRSACCCYMRLFSRHKHAESHITVSFSPGKRADIFFFLAGSQFDARKIEVGDQEAEWRCSRWHLLQGRKHRGHGAPRRSLLGRSWPTEVTSQQPTSAARAWEGTRCHLQLPHQQ